MAVCNETALEVDRLFELTKTLVSETIDEEAKLISVSLFFPFLIGLYADKVKNLRKALSEQLAKLDSMLTQHAGCWSQQTDHPASLKCYDQMRKLASAVQALKDIAYPEMHAVSAELKQLHEAFKSSECTSVVLAPVTSADEFSVAEDAAIELVWKGRFGAYPYSFVAPASEQARKQKVRHPLRPKLGGGGPTFWIECTVFDVQTWKVEVDANMRGDDVPAEAPFTFEWTLDGLTLTQGVQTAPTSSSLEIVVPAQSKFRHLGLKSTSKSGIVTQHARAFKTGMIREDCSQAEVPFLLPTASLLRKLR